MKALIFILLATAVYAQTSNYALINSDGTVIEVMVSDPVNAATYPQAGLQVFPDAVKCVPALGASMGWHYDYTTNTFTAPLLETTLDVSKAPSTFTLQNPTPVTLTPSVTTNNAVATPVVTTNNISITTNNSP
jgi:hypothetical protein